MGVCSKHHMNRWLSLFLAGRQMIHDEELMQDKVEGLSDVKAVKLQQGCIGFAPCTGAARGSLSIPTTQKDLCPNQKPTDSSS